MPHDRKLGNCLKLLALLLAALVMPVTMGGCDGAKATYNGKELDAPSLLGEVARVENEARAKAEAEEKADRAEAKRVASKAAAESIAASAKLDITAAEVKAELARIQAESGIAMQALAERSEARARELQATFAAIREQADAAFAVIEAKEQQRSALIGFVANNPIVKSAAASVGVDTGGLGAILGTGAASAALMAWRGRAVKDKVQTDAKSERDTLRKDLQAKIDAAWQEGFDLAQKERDRADAAFDEASTRMALLHTPPPAKV